MTLENLCSLFDQCDIVDKQIDLSHDYYSISENIYTDGKLSHNINREAYIHITDLKDATYIAFIDKSHNVYLCIYRYTQETKYKEILDKFNVLKSIARGESKQSRNNKPNAIISSDIIDINAFKCTECDSDDDLVYKRSSSNPDILMTKCEKCKTEYTFTPSKYYKLASKRVINSKSTTSRTINIQEDKKEK